MVVRRPYVKSGYKAKDFLPCEFCLSFHLKSSLWTHIEKCKFKPTEKLASANYVRNALTMMSPFLKDSNVNEEDAQLEEFFRHMKETTANPGVPDVCRNDPLIWEFSSMLLHRLY